MRLPEEFQSLIDYAEAVRNITEPIPAKPKPCLNVIAVGGAGGGKLTATVAYGQALLEKKFITQKHSVVDCGEISSVGNMFARLTNEFERAKGGGMIIFENAQHLADDPVVLSTMIDLQEETGCVVALVGDKKGIEKLCGIDQGIARRFPTMMDTDKPAAPKPTMQELSSLPADMKAMKKLQLKKPTTTA